LPLEVLIFKCREHDLTKGAGEGKPVKRTARMFDDWATPRSPFVVAYSPRSHPNASTDSSLSSTLRFQFIIPVYISLQCIYHCGNMNSQFHIAHEYLKPSSKTRRKYTRQSFISKMLALKIIYQRIGTYRS